MELKINLFLKKIKNKGEGFQWSVIKMRENTKISIGHNYLCLGLNPNADLHTTYLNIEPMTGKLLVGGFRL